MNSLKLKLFLIIGLSILNLDLIHSQESSTNISQLNQTNDQKLEYLDESDKKSIREDLESKEEQNNCIINNMEKLKKLLKEETFESLYNSISILQDYIPIGLNHKIDNFNEMENKKTVIQSNLRANFFLKAEDELKKIIKNSIVSFMISIILDSYENSICNEIDDNQSLSEIISFIKSKLN